MVIFSRRENLNIFKLLRIGVFFIDFETIIEMYLKKDDGEEDEPEPDEDVDLLVDDVERQDAQTVDGLDRA